MMQLKWISTLLCLVFLGTCQKNPVAPSGPGARTYVWTVDTLASPYNELRNLWGASPDDVWAVGPYGITKANLWHYNGTEWTPYIPSLIGWRGDALYGFSRNNVWMGGEIGVDLGRAGLLHYDGTHWYPRYSLEPDSAVMARVNSIHGIAPDDVYACGVIGYNIVGESTYRGFILHYDGTQWSEVHRTTGEAQFLEVLQTKQHVFIHAIEDWYTNTFYELRGTQLEVIDARTVPGTMNLIGDVVVFTFRHQTYYYSQGSLQEWRRFAPENFGYQVWGRDAEDVFLRMFDGVAHYNGIDIEYLYHAPAGTDAPVGEPMIFEREVFFPMHDYALAPENRNMVLHGVTVNE